MRGCSVPACKMLALIPPRPAIVISIEIDSDVAVPVFTYVEAIAKGGMLAKIGPSPAVMKQMSVIKRNSEDKAARYIAPGSMLPITNNTTPVGRRK